MAFFGKFWKAGASFMNIATSDQWLGKAEIDYRSAIVLQRQRKEPLPDTVCYHCQQCAEKYLKAYLESQGETIERTHDLSRLLRACVTLEPKFQSCNASVVILNPYGIDIRYPGMDATVSDAEDTVKAIKELRRIVRRIMEL